ncbi:MAG: hypothetical protein IH614_09270, partial [Desulfuromonadales bacterium]|nr:hypothetical protein [Desulfuromonadales bacterium]
AEERVVAEAKKRQELEEQGARRQELERKLEALQQARQSEAQTIDELETAVRQAQQRTAVAEEQTRALATAATADGVRLTKLEQELRQTTALLATQEAEHQRLRQAWGETEKDRLANAAAVDDRQLDSLQEELRQARAASEAERLRRQQMEETQRASEARLAELQLALEQAGSKARIAVAAPPAAVDSELPSLREALRQAEAEAELLHLENGRLAAAKALAEQQLAQLQALGPLSEAAAGKSETAPKRLGLGTLMLAKTDPGPPPHVVRRPPPAGAFFHVDWDLTAIPRQRAADLCEIHQSIGFAQLSIEGYPTQYCNAFIVVVKDGEQKRLFMPFRLSSSNRLLVYVPAEQPSSDGVLAKAMKEANRFLQVVGMETERVSLGRKGKLPPELEAILAIGSSTRNAGNF